MPKARRGLPEGFDLAISARSPVILGDFLDEVAGAQLSIQASKSPEPRAIEPSPERPAKPGFAISPLAAAPERSPNPNVVPLQRSGFTKRPRFELSLNHETKRMVRDLLSYVQAMGPQPAATGSEMFQGIISVLVRAKSILDLSSLPRRGQWGTPTAKAFPIALGQAFAKAIAEQYIAESTGGVVDSQATPKVVE